MVNYLCYHSTFITLKYNFPLKIFWKKVSHVLANQTPESFPVFRRAEGPQYFKDEYNLVLKSSFCVYDYVPK